MEDRSVKSSGNLRGLSVDSSHDFGDIPARYSSVAGILAFWGKSHKEFPLSVGSSASGLKSQLVLFFENRHHHFFRGARVSCTFENHQLPSL